MNKKAFIASIATSKKPIKVSNEHFIEVDAKVRDHIRQDPKIKEFAADMTRKTTIRSRYTITPFFIPEDERPDDVEDIFTPENFCPSPKKRLKFWLDYGIPMGIEAAEQALKEWGKPKDQISHVIAVSSTGNYQPGLEQAVIETLGLSLDCEKVGIYDAGCGSGICALRLAKDAVLGGATGVLVVGSEVSSAAYDPLAMYTSSINANALFADGAAAAVIAPEGEWKIEKMGNSIVKDSAHMMYFGLDIHSPSARGTELFIHPQIGSRLAKFFKQEKGSEILDDILSHTKTHPAFAVHLGGPLPYKMRPALTSRGWPKDVLDLSLNTLQENGNMIFVSIFNVLLNTMKQVDNDNIVLMAFCTGLSVEWGLISKNT